MATGTLSQTNYCPNEGCFVVNPELSAADVMDAATARLGEARAIIEDMQAAATDAGESPRSMILWGVSALLSDAAKAFDYAYDHARRGDRP